MQLSRQNVVEGWRQFLCRYEWDLFVTGTYDFKRVFEYRQKSGVKYKFQRRNPHPEQVLKDVRHWVNLSNREMHGSHWERRTPGIYWAVALERMRSGEWHWHALVRDAEIPLHERAFTSVRADLRELWFKLHGRADLQVPRSVEDTAEYCAKYIVKESNLFLCDHLEAPAQLCAI